MGVIALAALTLHLLQQEAVASSESFDSRSHETVGCVARSAYARFSARVEAGVYNQRP
jgi:hypothetical protein